MGKRFFSRMCCFRTFVWLGRIMRFVRRSVWRTELEQIVMVGWHELTPQLRTEL